MEYDKKLDYTKCHTSVTVHDASSHIAGQKSFTGDAHTIVITYRLVTFPLLSRRQTHVSMSNAMFAVSHPAVGALSPIFA